MKYFINSKLLELLCSPTSNQILHLEGDTFITSDRKERFHISEQGIPLFAADFISDEGRVQQTHYDTITMAYVENLTYPHTQEYMAYLDKGLFAEIGDAPLGCMAELCCGRGEAISLFRDRYDIAIGVDVSQKMLEAACHVFSENNVMFLQGDVTKLPIMSESCDTVVMLGGIHHVNDRKALYEQIMRVLKPGGRFIFREPVDDFVLWRWVRNVIYRFAPALNHETERPLRKSSTIRQLQQSGFEITGWKTYGFFGFCLFMNSDVLVFNRLFRFLPGIRALTRFSAKIDELIAKVPGMEDAGLIVVGSARRPEPEVLCKET